MLTPMRTKSLGLLTAVDRLKAGSRETLVRALVAGLLGSLVGVTPAEAAVAGDAGVFAESELWDSTDDDAYLSLHVQGLAVIPAGVVPPAGGGQALADDVVLAFTEGRFVVGDGGPKDLLVRRSVNGGRTWSASVPVVPADPAHSWGSATPVVDEQTGRCACSTKDPTELFSSSEVMTPGPAGQPPKT
jgi:hypothetical protein